MSGDDHEEFEEKIINWKQNLEYFRVSEHDEQYLRTVCNMDFKPENYYLLLEWTVEKLRKLDNEYSDLIDKHIEKSQQTME